MGAHASVPALAPVKITTGDTFKMTARGAAIAIGVDDVDNIGWFKQTSLFTSLDNVSLTTQVAPVGVTTSLIPKIVRFGASIYCIGVLQADGFLHVWKSQPPSAGACNWSSVLTMVGNGGIAGVLNKSTWGTSDYLYAADYADPVGGPSIWRSPNGTTWTKTLGPISGLRHFHCVAPDPYTPGHVYATAGDGQSKVLYRSTDSGATWTLLVTDNAFQAAQISFTPDWVYFAGDTGYLTVWVLNRQNATVPIVASSNMHWHHAVPGAGGARGPYTDGVTTNNSPTFTSATAAFTADDAGRQLRFPSGSTPISEAGGVFIKAYVNATTVTLNQNAGANTTGQTFYVEGDTFFRAAFFGAVDPATGIYYCNANDDTAMGTRSALFCLPQVGGRVELLESYRQLTKGDIYFRAGKVYCGQAVHPLLALAP